MEWFERTVSASSDAEMVGWESEAAEIKQICPSNPFTYGESRSDGYTYRLAVYPMKTLEISSAHIMFLCVKILNYFKSEDDVR